MSLAEKWKEHVEQMALKPGAGWSSFRIARMREAFYAGAEAAIKEIDPQNSQAAYIQQEIEHFKDRP
jgi:hypothetical protein